MRFISNEKRKQIWLRILFFQTKNKSFRGCEIDDIELCEKMAQVEILSLRYFFTYSECYLNLRAFHISIRQFTSITQISMNTAENEHIVVRIKKGASNKPRPIAFPVEDSYNIIFLQCEWHHDTWTTAKLPEIEGTLSEEEQDWESARVGLHQVRI